MNIDLQLITFPTVRLEDVFDAIGQNKAKISGVGFLPPVPRYRPETAA